MATAPKSPEFMTVDAFLGWDAPVGQIWQLIDGVPVAMAPASPLHGAIQSRVDRLIGAFLEQRSDPSTIVTTAGVIIPSRSDSNVRIPDLAVTCSPIRAGDAVLTDPVLLIEILSPSNQAETWVNVWAYTTIPSVREIVVFRTATIGALLLRRGADGVWPDQPVSITEGTVFLESIGFAMAIEEVYRTTLLAAVATS
jgi:Uma2 family endonuclease